MNLRNQFPVLENCLYFNTAYTAPLSKDLLAWWQRDNLIYFEKGDQYKMTEEKVYEKAVRSALSKFLSADVENTYVTGNFSSAFQNFLIQLPANYRFLVLEDEYPSLTGIIDDLGFKSTLIPLETKVEQRVLEKLHTSTFEVLAISAIQYTSGLYFDLTFLEKIKSIFPNLLILVDGTQFIGAEAFHFEQSGIDAIFGSSYKWLLGGYGCGFVAIKSSVFSHLNCSQDKLKILFDRGQLSIQALGSLSCALDTIQRANYSELLAYKKELTLFLKKGLIERNLLQKWIVDRPLHSSIFNLQLHKDHFLKLIENNVRCVQRGSGVRIAVHHYNTKKEVLQLFKILDQFI